jgi:glutamate synthase domain-containing protein 3
MGRYKKIRSMIKKFSFDYEIENTHRSVGTRLSHYLYKKFGDNNLNENSIVQLIFQVQLVNRLEHLQSKD